MEYIFKDIRNTKQFYKVLSNPLFFNKLSQPEIFERVFELYQKYDDTENNHILLYFLNKIIKKRYTDESYERIREIIYNIIEPLINYDDDFCCLIRDEIHNYIEYDIITINNIIKHYSYNENINIISKIRYYYSIPNKKIIEDNEYKMFYDILYKKREIGNIKKYYKTNKFTNKTLLNLVLVSNDYESLGDIKKIIYEINKNGYYMKYEDLEYLFSNCQKVINNKTIFIIKQLLNKYNMRKEVLDIILREYPYDKFEEKHLDILEDFGNLDVYPSDIFIIRLLSPTLKKFRKLSEIKNDRRYNYIKSYIKQKDVINQRLMLSIINKNDIEIARLIHDNKFFFNDICVNIGLGTFDEEWIEFFITNAYYVSDEMIEEIIEQKYWSHYDFLMNLKANGFLPYWIDI